MQRVTIWGPALLIMCCPTTKFVICFSLVWAGSEFVSVYFYFLPADKLGSVKTSEYTDKKLPLSFQNVKKKKKKKGKDKKLDNKICIVHCSTIGNKKCLCIFMWRSFSYFIWKDEQGLLPSFYFPFCFRKAVFAKLNARISDCLEERYCHNLWLVVQSCVLLSFIFPEWAKHCPVFVTIL